MDRIVVGMSGASGIPYGVRLLEALKEQPVETHFVATDSARLVHQHECDDDWAEVEALADVVHGNADIAASIASGSFRARAMVIIPCSMDTLGKLAAGVNDNLLTRAGAVMLKERRPLILVPRETPFSHIHIENMLRLSTAGTIIAPAAPAFYNRPQSLDDNVNFIAGRVLDLLGLDADLFARWEGG